MGFANTPAPSGLRAVSLNNGNLLLLRSSTRWIQVADRRLYLEQFQINSSVTLVSVCARSISISLWFWKISSLLGLLQMLWGTAASHHPRP